MAVLFKMGELWEASESRREDEKKMQKCNLILLF